MLKSPYRTLIFTIITSNSTPQLTMCMPTVSGAQNFHHYVGHIFDNRVLFQKIFEEEMLIRTQPTTLLQMFQEFLITFKLISKSFIDPDNIFGMNGLMG